VWVCKRNKDNVGFGRFWAFLPRSVDTQNTLGGDAYQNELLMTKTKGRAIGVKFSVVPVPPLL
jgi:hypothetical protein